MKKIVTGISILCAAFIIVAVAAFAYYNHAALFSPGGNPPVLGTFVSSTPTSLTIVLKDGTQKTFTAAASVPVESEVKGDSPALSLATLVPQTPLAVLTVKAGSTNVTNIQVLSIVPPPLPSPLGPTTQVSGTVTARTTSTLTLKTQTGTVQVLLAASTAVYTRVVTGQKGKLLGDITVGDSVNVIGVAGSSGLEAELIQL